MLTDEQRIDLHIWRSVRDFPAVYFVTFDDQNVKIGWTRDLSQRIRELDVYPAPIRLLWAQIGTVTDEREFHRRYERLRLHREWFKYDSPIVDYVNARRAAALEVAA